MGGCQNSGSRLGPLNTRCRIILRTQKGTIILTTTHMVEEEIFSLKKTALASAAAKVGHFGGLVVRVGGESASSSEVLLPVAGQFFSSF